jgi:RimJ/RimL family protein N-acetyltransferase
MLKGEKITLRPIKMEDINLFLKWVNDPEIIQYLTMYLPMTEIAERKWVEDASIVSRNTEVHFSIELNSVEKTIGNCGLHKINWHDRDCEMGTVIGEKSFWGKGYGTEVVKLLINYGFGELNMNRISAGVYGFNERSRKSAEKNGFKQEGIVRKAVYKKGHYHDKILLGILREEWEKNK